LFPIISLLFDFSFVHVLCAVGESVADDEQYFIFADVVEELLLCFSRDPWVHSNSSLSPTRDPVIASFPSSNAAPAALKRELRGGPKFPPESAMSISAFKPLKHSSSAAVQRLRASGPSLTQIDTPSMLPPCGVLPFQGMALYAAPFTYVFDTSEQAYFLFRAMYTVPHPIIWFFIAIKVELNQQSCLLSALFCAFAFHIIASALHSLVVANV
jgi:hypothetical protein